MGQQFVGDDFARGTEVCNGICKIGRVPIDNRGDDEVAAAVEQAIEDVGRLVGGGRDDLHIIGSVLIGNVGVKRKAWIDAKRR